MRWRIPTRRELAERVLPLVFCFVSGALINWGRSTGRLPLWWMVALLAMVVLLASIPLIVEWVQDSRWGRRW
jgi:hypothetical protein